MFGSNKRRRAWLAAPIALATAFAVAVPLAGSASADHANYTVVLTPGPTDSAAVGTCNGFVVTLRDPQGNADPGETIDVELRERVTSPETFGAETGEVTFCQVGADGSANDTATFNQTPQNVTVTNSGTAADRDNAEFVTDSNGQVRFGITRNNAGEVDVIAFYEGCSATSTPACPNPTTDDDRPVDAGNPPNTSGADPQDTTLKTFTAGGNAAARFVDAEPETQNASVNTLNGVNFTVLVTNAAGDPVPAANGGGGNDVTARVTSGPNQGAVVVCTDTNNNGISRCSYSTGSGTGTDTIVAFLNQTNADNNVLTNDTAGPDASEPQDTITAVIGGFNLSNLQVQLECTSPGSTEACINPLSKPTETFTATVTRADGTDADTARDLVSGVLVRFAITSRTNGVPANNTTSDATVSPAEATTGADGKASTTLTNPSPVEGDSFVVTATIANQDPAGDPGTLNRGATSNEEITVDSASKTFADNTVSSDARNIVLTPETATTQSAAARTFTATVTDRFGRPVRNVDVTFTEDGVGRFANGSTSITVRTNASGVATAEVTSLANEAGTQTITATIVGFASSPSGAATARGTGLSDDQCELAAGNPAGAGAGNCSDTSTNTFVTQSPSASPTGTGTPAPTGSATATPGPGPNCQTGTPFGVTLRSNVTQITAGNAPTLTGTVLNTANQPCASTNVTIFKKSFGEAAYTAVATVTTNAQGVFTLVVRPLVQTSYGANVSDSVRSNIVNIRVYTRVNIVSPRSTPAPGSTPVNNPVTFTGNLFPGYSNIAVGLGTLINGRFSVLQQTRSNSTGGYSITRTLPRGTGVYVIFVSAVSQGSDKGSKSITLTVS